METITLIHVQIVHKEVVKTGVMEIANGSMDSVTQKVCKPQSLKTGNVFESGTRPTMENI